MENISELLDEVFNYDKPEESEKIQMSTEELRKAYTQAEDIKGRTFKGMECLGVICEPFYDISIFRDASGKFWYSSYYVGD